MKALIIGSGLVGTSTAYYLNQYGFEVSVVERLEGAGLETSFANGGMLTPSQANPWNTPGVLWDLLKWIGKEDAPLLLRMGTLPSLAAWGIQFLRHSSRARFQSNLARNIQLCRYTLTQLQDLRKQVELDYDAGTTHGTMKVFREQQVLDESLRVLPVFDELGVRYRVLDGRGVIDAEPALTSIAEALVGGLAFPDDEHGDAHKFCVALATEATAKGVEFRYRTEVEQLRVEAGKLSGVVINGNVEPIDVVVLATGPYSPLLAKTVGLRVPVRPVKGYSLTLPFNDWPTPPRIPIVDESLHTAVTPLGQRLRVAGTAEFAGYDKTIRAARIDYLYSLLWQIFPDFKAHFDRQLASEWTGLRPMTYDDGAILGGTPIKNLYLNTGHGHLGWSMALGSSKAVADEIAGLTPEFDLSPYRLDRF